MNPDWPGNFQVAYWTSEWRTVATTYLDRMIKLGYDEMYLDVVDEYQRLGLREMSRVAMPQAQWSI